MNVNVTTDKFHVMSRLNLPAAKLPVQAPYEMTGPDSSVIQLDCYIAKSYS